MGRVSKILYIDDELQNLNSFRATFRREFEILTALSACEALKTLDREEVQIIIADQKMPEMSGIEFFKKIITEKPEPIRILLTGYTDIDALTDAINIGNIYRYILKPWDELELRNALKNALDTYYDRLLLKEKIIELENINEELNKFIYSISHDLRAPVASIKGILNLVQMEENQIKDLTQQNEYWKMVDTCVSKLDFYIRKTIQYHRANKPTIDCVEINFETIIKNILSYQICSKEEVKINYEVNKNSTFYSDNFLMEIILSNVISNALNYQKEKEENKYVDIKIDINTENAVICVRDNGIGIDESLIENVFNQFFKGKNHQGSGLGLYIVKQTTHKLKGEINIQSQKGIGTQVEIRIPNII